MGHSAKTVNGFVTQKVSHVRSNGLEVFCRESCSKKFRKILRKTLRNTENTRVSFLIQLQEQPLKNLKGYGVLRTPFFTEHLWWLLLSCASRSVLKHHRLICPLYYFMRSNLNYLLRLMKSGPRKSQ